MSEISLPNPSLVPRTGFQALEGKNHPRARVLVAAPTSFLPPTWVLSPKSNYASENAGHQCAATPSPLTRDNKEGRAH